MGSLLVAIIDPLQLKELLWPDITFYDKQREIIYSVWNNDETVVGAGNMLGKDFVSGFLALAFFLTRPLLNGLPQCRIVTTSVKDDHLRVLWGEIGNLISTSKTPLRSTEGGPLIVNHHEIKRIFNGQIVDKTYLIGMVAKEGAAMQGHHLPRSKGNIPHTLFLADEASGVDDEYYKNAKTWFHRALIIGNCWPCNNFFYRAIEGDPAGQDKGGDIPRIEGSGYYRKVLHIGGEDSPNVKYAEKEKETGRKVSHTERIPGVLSYSEYTKRMALFNEHEKTVSVHGKFYKGASIMMFPELWLNRANHIAKERGFRTRGRAIGCDPAEGGDSSCWSVVDDYGLLALISMKTPDTSIITTETIRLMRIWGVDPSDVWFDRGGGGKQHVDRLRDQGFNVRSIAFGEAASEVDRFSTWRRSKGRKIDEYEGRTVYKNRRAEIYGIIRNLIDPLNEEGFGIPEEFTELRRQLAPIPLRYGRDGVMFLLPKNKDKEGSNEECLKDLLGCSPDEADSLGLAVFGLMEAKAPKPFVGAIQVEV